MRRKQFIIGAGLGLVASVAAACTTYGRNEDSGSDSPTTEPASASGPGTPAADAIAKTADVPVGSGVIVDDIVLTQASAGDFKAFSAICTHAGCKLADVAGGTINCPCHGSKFNLDGTVANGPASRPLNAEAVSVQGDSIVLG
ncbi:QcrA and Rieske domain-containing protein [Mycobacterium deserti]|uniref:Cytochrome bc1 complex Rieske iron-sulfur subunit n=1 Tax=Mycobacterium deserti TaxID=2978347 RepID=A0ABT2MF90_9MYCO|nr:Rieske (2Fe-2S) protein [Mycobacterium deserti]MCT7660944.1 Rieske (2Fe-2S) protein [Mycobacterium deserti]